MLLSSARISKKVEEGIGIEIGYRLLSMPIPIVKGGGSNTSRAVIVPGTTIGSGGEIPYPPVIRALLLSYIISY